MYTQLRTQTHTLPLHSKQTHSPTHMKNKHSHEIHPHIKTNAQSWSLSHSQHCYHIKAFAQRRLTCMWGTFCGVRGGEETRWEAGGRGAHGWEAWFGVGARCWGGRCVCCVWAFWAGGARPWLGAGTPCWVVVGPWKPMGVGCWGFPFREACCWAWRWRCSTVWLTGASWGPGSRDEQHHYWHGCTFYLLSITKTLKLSQCYTFLVLFWFQSPKPSKNIAESSK